MFLRRSQHRGVALVTGASSGFGHAIARAYAREGADVILTARRLNRFEELAAEMTAIGRGSLPIKADLRREVDVVSLVDKAVSAFGRIDLLCNNAGVLSHKSLQKTTPYEWGRSWYGRSLLNQAPI